ncbi:MAG TPA: type II toxin-antitoxin system RatA family toxin [Steroidobacteraceae bacterium]|nr:type II toxin-antitoxin system RatA family toxin [Steroidobacteraceae bacterium]
MLSEEATRSLPYASVALFDLAADLERYPQYLPGWISTRVYGREPEVCYAEQVIGFGPVSMQFRTTARMHRPEHIDITSDDSRFSHFHLLWRFEQDSGRASCVTLRVELELRSRFLQGWLERTGPGTAAKVLRVFEQRAGQLYGSSRQGLT